MPSSLPESVSAAPRGKALLGLRVAELGSGFGSAYATKLIADLGGEVIKIEPLGGDPIRKRGPLLRGTESSALFAYLNTSKRSVTIDHGSEEGREMIRALCRRCDAAVIDLDSLCDLEPELGPGAISKLGTPFVVVAMRNMPKGIGFDYGTDINAQALAALCHQMGQADRHPLFWPYSLGAYQAGLTACVALLGRLYAQNRDEGSTTIDVSVFRTLGTLMQGHGTHVYRYFGDVPGRHGSRAVMRPWPTGLFPCKDGLVALHCADDTMWHRLCQMMGDPPWARRPEFEDRQRLARSPEQGDRHLLPWLASRTKKELLDEALRRRLSLAPVFTNIEVAESEQLEERSFWVNVQDGEGKSFRFPGAPYRLSVTPSDPGQSPALGEYTRTALDILGHDEFEIERMREVGIV